MTFRWFNAVVLVLWLVAMAWLISQKVVPPMLAGNPPDYESALPLAAVDAAPPSPVGWRVAIKKQAIGVAASQAVPHGEGAELRSVMQFENLPVGEVLRGLLGSLAGRLLHDSFGRAEFAPNITVATRMRFAETKRLTDFETVVDLDDYPRIIHLVGDVDATGKLRMVATARVGQSPPVTHRQELDLPPDALVGDALSPRSELKGLKLGQRWTMPTYRPFPPNSAVQIVSAEVSGSELLKFEGELVQTLIVVYQDEAGSGLATARAPIGRTWVTPEGTILRQEVSLSNLLLTLERLPADEIEDAARMLADEEFGRFFVEQQRKTGRPPARGSKTPIHAPSSSVTSP